MRCRGLNSAAVNPPLSPIPAFGVSEVTERTRAQVELETFPIVLRRSSKFLHPPFLGDIFVSSHARSYLPLFSFGGVLA